MKFLVLLILLLNVAAYAKSGDPDKIVLGFVPGENIEMLRRGAEELSKALQSKLGVPVEIFIPSNYQGLEDSMKEGRVDFAFFTALTFVDAEEKAGVKVLLKKVWDTPFYYSAIVTNKKSKIRNIKDLKGKKFGFVDEKSASGYLYPSVMLKKSKIDAKKYFSEVKFYGNHEAAMQALWEGKTDAVAVYSNDNKGKTGAWTKADPLKSKDVQILWISAPIPNDPFCVRKSFYEKYPRYTHELMFALIDMQEMPDNILKKMFGIESMTLATSRQYDPVRELAKYMR